MKRDGHRCKRCGSPYQLQVHHYEYIDGRMAWEYDGSYVDTLCDPCHRYFHKKGDPMHELQLALDRLVAVAGGGVRAWCEAISNKEEKEGEHG